MKIALQIVLGIIVLFAAFWLISAVLGWLMGLLIVVGIVAVIAAILRAVWNAQQAKKLPERAAAAQKHLDKQADHALKDLERKVNKS